MPLNIARPQRVLGLQGGDRMGRMAPPERLRRRFGHAEMPHLALLDQPGHGPDRLLDRHRRVDPVLVVQIDHIDLQALQTRFASLLHIFGPAIDRRLAVGAAHIAELRCDDVLVPLALDGAGQQRLVLAGAIEVRAIEMADANLRRPVQRGDRLLLGPWCVEPRHHHAAKADHRQIDIAAAKFPGFHLSALPGGQWPLNRLRRGE